MSEIVERLAALQAEIAARAEAVGRTPESVRLIGVSKGQPVESIMQAYDAGLRDFGESYAQELQAKAGSLPEDIVWHFIGRLQTNKVRDVVQWATWIHSVDRPSLVRELKRRLQRKTNILVQVSPAGEEQKGGVSPEQLPELLERIAESELIEPRGLMVIPPLADDHELTRAHFKTLSELLPEAQGELERSHPELARGFTELSMGMSADYPQAVEEGATMVRVGSVLFGARRDNG